MDRRELLLNVMDGLGLLVVIYTMLCMLVGWCYLPFLGVLSISLSPSERVIILYSTGIGIMLMVYRIRYKIERSIQLNSTYKQQRKS